MNCKHEWASGLEGTPQGHLRHVSGPRPGASIASIGCVRTHAGAAPAIGHSEVPPRSAFLRDGQSASAPLEAELNLRRTQPRRCQERCIYEVGKLRPDRLFRSLGRFDAIGDQPFVPREVNHKHITSIGIARTGVQRIDGLMSTFGAGVPATCMIQQRISFELPNQSRLGL